MIIKSRYPDLELPSLDIFSFLFKRQDRKFPDRHPIFQDGLTGRAYTFGDVQQLAEQFGQGLRSRYDWRKGDVLAISALSDIDMPPVILGALWAGGTVSTSNPDYTAMELSDQLRHSGAKCVVGQYSNIETIKKACLALGIADDHIILLGDQRDLTGHFKHWTSIRNLSVATRFAPRRYDPKNDTAFLIYSSGTTGKPKGVKLSHYNITSNILQLQVAEGFNLTWDGSRTTRDIPLPEPGTGGDKILACLPFFHIYGLTVLVHSPLYSGVTTVVMPRFNVDKWCQLAQEQRITYSYIVPPIVLHLAKHPSVSSYDLSSLRMTQSGAAPLTRELIEQVYKRLKVRIKQGYGLSETSPCLYQGSWGEWDTDIGCCGALLPNLEAKICKPCDCSGGDGVASWPTELQPGEAGELYVRGPNVFKGYHNDPQATDECVSPDGWFRTGDIGYVTETGNLFITDRVKELIKYNGFQVPPAELEGYLIEFPGVVDCAVVGVYHEQLATEVPRAYIVTEDALKPLDVNELQKWFNGRVAHYKKLRGGVRLVEKIPKNASGKILRKVLKEIARKESETLRANL
ncbi:Fc.00g055860.m01.CDS01 [Cosmosporella sp. VM-42]